MTRAMSATEQGLEPHWKVRIVLPSAMLHCASWSEPKWSDSQVRETGRAAVGADRRAGVRRHDRVHRLVGGHRSLVAVLHMSIDDELDRLRQLADDGVIEWDDADQMMRLALDLDAAPGQWDYLAQLDADDA